MSSAASCVTGPAADRRKRRALYGAEAFGRSEAPSSPTVPTEITLAYANCEKNQPSASRSISVDECRPTKLRRTETNNVTDPGALTRNETPGRTQTSTQQEFSHATSDHHIQASSVLVTHASLSNHNSGAFRSSGKSSACNDKGGTDLDRDDHGNLLPAHRLLPIWRTQHESDNLYDYSGSQVAIAIRNCVQGLKRKCAHLSENNILPPPAFIWRGSSDPNWTVFQGFLLYPELCFLLAAHLPLNDLIKLYSISREFHIIIDARFTTTCLTITNNKAPQSSRIFHFRSYAHLCRPDPANRIPHPNPAKAMAGQPRMIPSFRWVAMVLFREKVVHELMAIFAENGVPLPARVEPVLKKIWFLMDLPDNPRRIGLIHNPNQISDDDLYFMFCFLVKLDMICHDPLSPEKHDGLRKLLLSASNGLLTLLLVLKRRKWCRQADLLIAWVRHSHEIREAHDDPFNFDPVAYGAESIFGVPIHEAGLGKYEYWGRKGAIRRLKLPSHPAGPPQRFGILLRPDQLVMREAVRRGLRFSKVVLKALLCGYIDDQTLESFPPKPYPRRIPEWNGEEYDIDDIVGGVSALSVEEGGDPLLDLGRTSSDHGGRAPLVVARDDSSRSQEDILHTARQSRDAEEAFLNLCVHFCETEFVKVGKEDPILQEELCVLPGRVAD